MNVCMVLRNSAFPGDIRVENEATAIVQAGHNVFVVCDPLPGRNQYETYKGIQILRISSPRNLLYKKLTE